MPTTKTKILKPLFNLNSYHESLSVYKESVGHASFHTKSSIVEKPKKSKRVRKKKHRKQTESPSLQSQSAESTRSYNFPTIITKSQPTKNVTLVSPAREEKYVRLKTVIKQVRTEASTEDLKVKDRPPQIKIHRSSNAIPLSLDKQALSQRIIVAQGVGGRNKPLVAKEKSNIDLPLPPIVTVSSTNRTRISSPQVQDSSRQTTSS